MKSRNSELEVGFAMETVEMQVRLHCKGCERSVRKALSKLKGVQSVEIDMNSHKITVAGSVDQKMVLKTVRKTGRRAEPWPTHITPKSKISHPHISAYNKYRKQTYHGNLCYMKLSEYYKAEASMFSHDKTNTPTLMYMITSLAKRFHCKHRR